MTRVLITGMSGTGKSSVLAVLAQRGHRAVDADHGYAVEVVAADGGLEQRWDEERMAALLAGHREGALFVAGCAANQVKFYDRFDAVVLLSAPLDMLLERIATRTLNSFGKSDAERARIVQDLRAIEPLLRARATVEITTDQPLGDVADAVERAALHSRSS